MSNDIVVRLRESDGGYFMRQMFSEAADEIERLREMLRLEREECAACAIDRKETQRERDEARRMWCEAAPVGNSLSVNDMDIRARAEATRRGWDCFKKEDEQ